jgi:hypothetical protein
MKIGKTVTPAKAAANKKNAEEESTGPTSIPGKARASQNAIVHGILARDMLLRGESGKELEQLQSYMNSSKAPVGAGESFQVEIIICNRWRLRRFYRAEAGEIAKILADAEPGTETVASSTSQYNRAAADLTKLKEIEAQIDSEARVSTENLDWLQTLSYGEPVQQFLRGIEVGQAAVPAESARPSPGVPAAEESRRPPSANKGATLEQQGEWEFGRAMMQSGLEGLKNAIHQVQLHHFEHLIRRVSAQSAAAQVPQEAVLDRLMRYENQLLRNIYRAEHELERMQRLRLGEKVPPPSARVN